MEYSELIEVFTDEHPAHVPHLAGTNGMEALAS